VEVLERMLPLSFELVDELVVFCGGLTVVRRSLRAGGFKPLPRFALGPLDLLELTW
jgi:hypothetical protein